MIGDGVRPESLIKHPFGSWRPWSGVMILTGTMGAGKSRMATAYALEAVLQHHVTFLTTEFPADTLRHTIVKEAHRRGVSTEKRLTVHNLHGNLDKVLEAALMFARKADLLIIDQISLKKESISKTMISIREMEKMFDTSIIITLPARDSMLLPHAIIPSRANPEPTHPSFSEHADIVMSMRRSRRGAPIEGLSDDSIVNMMEGTMNGNRPVELYCNKCRYDSTGKGVLVDLTTLTSLGEIE